MQLIYIVDLYKLHTLWDEPQVHLKLCDHSTQKPYESCVFFWKLPAGSLDCGVCRECLWKKTRVRSVYQRYTGKELESLGNTMKNDIVWLLA